MSIYSAATNRSNAQKVVDYEINQRFEKEIKFNKKGAAEQLAIEVESLYNILIFYSEQYFYNNDLSKKDENSNMTNAFMHYDVYTEIIVDDGHTPYATVLYNKSVIRATPFLTWNGYIENKFSPTLYDPINGDYQISHFCYLTSPIIPTKLYNDNGMYYVYIKDIPKFNSKLALDLDTFYSEVVRAETNREYLQNYIDTNHIIVDINYSSYFKNQYFTAYMDMRTSIMKASEIAANVKKELNEEIKTIIDL